MPDHMSLEAWLRNEGLPTLLTFIGFFPRVRSFMFANWSWTNEGFPTVFTQKRSLSCVSSFMLPKCTGWIKDFPTLLTRVRSTSSVPHPVAFKARRRADGFPTLPTLVGFLASMSPLMSSNWAPTTEGFSTLFTPIRLLSGVDSFMDSQWAGIVQTFSTHITLMRSTFRTSHNEFTKAGKRKEGFLMFLTLIRFVSSVRPGTDVGRVTAEGWLTLWTFGIPCLLSRVGTAGLPGRVRREDCPPHTALTEFYFSRPFLFQLMVRSLTEGFSIMATSSALTKSLYNMAAVKKKNQNNYKCFNHNFKPLIGFKFFIY